MEITIYDLGFRVRAHWALLTTTCKSSLQVTSLLEEGAKYKPLDALDTELPDLDPF